MIEINRRELKVLANRISVVARNAGVVQPLMGEAKDGVLTLWYNGMDLIIWHTIEVDGDLGLFSIPHDKFVRLIDAWNGETVKLKVNDDSSLTISSGRSRVKITHYEGAFDEIDDVPEGELIGTLSSDIIDSIKESRSFTAKTNLGRPELENTRVYTTDSQINVMASDSYHFYNYASDYGQDFNDDFMLPDNSSLVLATLLSNDMLVKLYAIGDSYLLVETDDGFTLRVTKGKGMYPNVDRVLTQEFTPYFTFLSSELLEAIKVGNVLSTDDTVLIEFDQEGGIKLNFIKSEAESELYLENIAFYDESDLKVTLRLSLLTHALGVLDSDKLIFMRNSDARTVSLVDPNDVNLKILIIETYF